MQLPLEIAFRNMERSPALEARTRTLAARLEKFSPQIIHCRVVVQAPHRHHSQGKLYDVTLRVTVPGREIAIRHANSADHAHEDPYIALRDAFKAARRQLQDYERERRHDVKTHTEPPRKRTLKLDRTDTAPLERKTPNFAQLRAQRFAKADARLDAELKQTFPASDPLPWTHQVK